MNSFDVSAKRLVRGVGPIPVPISHWETQNIHISPAKFEPTVPVFERFKVSLQFEILYF